MKKLMIAAAATAMVAGAFAAVGEECNEKVDCPFGYQIKVFLKTTEAGKVDYFAVKEGATTLADCSESICLRKPAVKRFAGFIYGTTAKEEVTCGEGGCCCNDWSNADLVMWNYDTKQEIDLSEAEPSIVLLDRIYNGDTTTAEICFDIGDMKHAGFGRVALRDGKWTLKYAAGFAAGLLPQKCTTCTEHDTCTEECTASEDMSVSVWAMCASEKSAPAVTAEKTAAYGKWTIDWSSTIANRVYNNQQVTQPGVGWQVATPVEFVYAAE